MCPLAAPIRSEHSLFILALRNIFIRKSDFEFNTAFDSERPNLLHQQTVIYRVKYAAEI